MDGELPLIDIDMVISLKIGGLEQLKRLNLEAIILPPPKIVSDGLHAIILPIGYIMHTSM